MKKFTLNIGNAAASHFTYLIFAGAVNLKHLS